MLKSRFPWPGVIVAALVFLAANASAKTPSEALSRAAENYLAVPRLAERLDYTVRFPDGRQESKAIEYGRTAGRIFLAMLAPDGTRIFHVTVGDGVLRAVQYNAGSAILEAPVGESLAATLDAVGAGQIGITLPPGLAAFEPDEGAFLESFRFGVLGMLRPTTVDTAKGVTRVTLSTEGGGAVARLDAGSGRLTGISLEIGEPGSSVRLDGTLNPIEVADEDPRWTVPTEARQPVATFAELEASAFPLGETARDLEIGSIEGESIALAPLRGRVVILDFWATWCVPCWKALEHVERVARWAEESARPISVWTVNTLEQTATFDEQASLAAEFLADRGLDVPVLVDVDDSFFAGMHSPGLPSTVIIAPDGTLAHYHTGVSEEMEESLRTQALALLAEMPE